jgi:hypothetical protein
MIRSRVLVALVLVAATGLSACWGDCSGGDSCPVYSVVAGRVTSPDGTPVAGLRLESQSATLVPGTGCDTTAMRVWNEAQTGPTGSYALVIDRTGFDEVDCSFLRIAAPANPGLPWNDTLIGPLQLGPFGTEPPEDKFSKPSLSEPPPNLRRPCTGPPPTPLPAVQTSAG